MIDVGIGLLVLRTVIGLLLVGHGIQKVSWRLGGAGSSVVSLRSRLRPGSG
jgi:uncharacterized membrane protein YphA (DoxX/SURF4 family)